MVTKKLPENSQKTGNRGGKTAGSFKPGKTGNPGGRPKRTKEEFDLIQACKGKTPAALLVIEGIMNNGDNERNKLAAAQAIIDRAYGKPTQTIGGDPDKPLQIVGTIRLVRAA